MNYDQIFNSMVFVGYILLILFLLLNMINYIIGSYSLIIISTLLLVANNISNQNPKFSSKTFNMSLPYILFIIIYSLTLSIIIKYKSKISIQSSNFYSYLSASLILLLVQQYSFYNYGKYVSFQVLLTIINLITLFTLGIILKYMTTDGFHIIRNM